MCTCYLDEGSGRCVLRGQGGGVSPEGVAFNVSLFPFMGNALIVLEVTYMFVLGVRLSLVEGFFSPSN